MAPTAPTAPTALTDPPRSAWRGTFHAASLVLAGLFLLALILLQLARWSTHLTVTGKVLIVAAAAALFGAGTGAAEIVLRYRDEPFEALASAPAKFYLLFNAGVSLAAFALLRRYGQQVLPIATQDLALTAFAAGFGGMAVMRSKLFSYQTESGNDLAAGPALIVDAFLRVLDRKIDRLRSAERERRVFDRVRSLFESGGITEDRFGFMCQFLAAHLLSYLNLQSSEKAEIATILRNYQTDAELSKWPITLRTLAVGFAILNVVGERNFDQVFGDLSDAIKLQAQIVAGRIPGS